MSVLQSVFENKHSPMKPIGTRITHSSGKTYVKESTGWYNVNTGKKLDNKGTLILEAEDNDTSTEFNIPNGYVYTSGKGNKFVFKNGTWFNASSKKPVNQSNVNMLNRSAQKSIQDFNSKNDIKIGSKVTSNKGVEYTYNGTGFVSADGKQISGGAAQAAMTKLKSQNAPKQSTDDATNDSAGDSDSKPVQEPTPTDTIVPGQSALDTANPEGTPTASSDASTDSSSSDYNAQSIINSQGAGSGTPTASPDAGTGTPPSPPSAAPSSSTQPQDKMTVLAQKIKGNKYNKQIITLLSRGGKMDLLAADILLNGNVKEVIDQLNSLNNSNTQ